MVVLSVAIVTSGKTLVARQFVEMTRLRVEGLLSAFPKLLDSGRDHTFIETETVRYIYQPMESLYLLLVTNKSSNILEDLETLRLLAKVVQDCCQIQVNEELVLKHAFDIVFAFDEVISFGHRESVTLSQIKTYTEMDSHEEKLHQTIEQAKMKEARDLAKRKQMELAKQRLTQPKADQPQMESLGSSSFQQDSMSSGAGPGKTGGMTMDIAPAPWSNAMTDDSGPVLKPTAPKKGMMLGKKKPGGDLFAGFETMDPAAAAASADPAAASAAAPEKAAPAVNPLLDPVVVDIEEKITAELQVEGGLSGEVACQGSFSVTVMDTAKADLVAFKLSTADKSFKYKMHPNLNKASHESNNVLEVRDAQRAYRGNTPLPLVKWHLKSSDEAFLPVSLSCWPTSTADGIQVVLELTLEHDNAVLEDIRVRFPCPASAAPSVSNAEPGQATTPSGMIEWYIPRMDSGEGSGTLEFSARCDQASLLPFTFEATAKDATRCPMNILECYHMERKETIAFTCNKASKYELTCGN
jgi:hypothetical protein